MLIVEKLVLNLFKNGFFSPKLMEIFTYHLVEISPEVALSKE